MLFHKDKNVLCIATKQETARNMVTKVKFMYDSLPSWLRVDFEENNKLSLRLKNGSQIKASSASSDAGRSEAVSLLLIDEAAFIEGINEIWASAQQTLATGGGAIVLSTPYGTGNWFHKTWVEAEEQINDFLTY
jgi:phage FluMu gp28-like protein